MEPGRERSTWSRSMNSKKQPCILRKTCFFGAVWGTVREAQKWDLDEMSTKNPWKVMIWRCCTRRGFLVLYWTYIELHTEYRWNKKWCRPYKQSALRTCKPIRLLLTALRREDNEECWHCYISKLVFDRSPSSVNRFWWFLDCWLATRELFHAETKRYPELEKTANFFQKN